MQPPPVFDLLGWMSRRGPWIAFAHSAERAWLFTHGNVSKGTRPSGVVRHCLEIARVAARCLRFLGASASLQLLLLIAWVFALIPIPVVRRYVSAALQKMTSILGDSYGLVANDSQRGAILTRFQETVDWLQTRCDKLVIVAHSQGTAVVHEAIGRRCPAAAALGDIRLRPCEAASASRVRIELAVAAHRSRVDPADRFGRGLATRMVPMGQRREPRNRPAHLFYTLYVSCLGCIVGAWSGWRNTRVQPVPAKISGR